MNKFNIISCAVASLLAGGAMSGCSSSSSSDSTTVDVKPTAADVKQYHELKGNFAEDVTLEAGTTYKITGEVNFLNGTTLTIPAGTTLYGATGNSYLAINAGAVIMAKGTQAAPIIFTSAQDVAGDNGNTIYQGQWGGLVIIGKAPIAADGGTQQYEAGDQIGGGTDAHDNSGDLEYVAIKNTGFEVQKDKELNGLSLLAVGDGTTIKNVAILGGSDDGLEIWGGTVNIDGIYVYDASDDSFDTDQGYTGTISNGYAQQYIIAATNYDSSGIETGNDADSYTSVGGTGNAIGELSLANDTQATMATYRNVTVEAIGGAIYLKNDAGGIFDNVSIISKDVPAGTNQTATANQAIVTHRTTDTVADLSGNPYGVQILSGASCADNANNICGLELINEVNASDIYAASTAKADTQGGCGPANTEGFTSCTDHIKNYWEQVPGVTPDTTLLFYHDVASVTGATIANIWKGKAGSNDKPFLQ